MKRLVCPSSQVVINPPYDPPVTPSRDVEPWDQPLALCLTRVETDWLDAEDGLPLTTCIVESSAKPVTLAGRNPKPLGDKQRIVLTAAQDLARKKLGGNPGVALLLRADVATLAIKNGCSRQAVSAAWIPLEKRGCFKLKEPASLEIRV